jgi:hypothetical protein
MRHGIRLEGEKVRGKKGLTGGSRVAVKQEWKMGRRLWWAERG